MVSWDLISSFFSSCFFFFFNIAYISLEHGGFYDHVAPPATGIPDPQPKVTSYPDKKFHWNRLGVRVPLVAVSPRIAKGTIVHDPPSEQRPFPNSMYEHCSMMATARKLLGVKGSLTARDAWAATFEHILTNAPRETPVVAPSPPPIPHEVTQAEAFLGISDLQQDILHVHKQIARKLADHEMVAAAELPKFQGDVHNTLVQLYEIVQGGVASLDTRHSLRVQSALLKSSQEVEHLWRNNFTLVRFESWSLNASGTKFCWNYSPAQNAEVTIALCRSDIHYAPQRFMYLEDGTIRQPTSMDHCVTATPAVGASNSSSSQQLGAWRLQLKPCTEGDALMQQFDFDGTIWMGYLVMQVVAF